MTNLHPHTTILLSYPNRMLLPPHPPMQSLSVQSFHNDSPPFIGSTERNLEPVPGFALDGRGGPHAEAGMGSYALSAATPRSLQQPTRLPLTTDGNARPVLTTTVPTPSEGGASRRTSPPDSPGTRSVVSNPLGAPGMASGDGNIGPMGDMNAYTDLDRPSRINSPIDLTEEARSYTFPKHRLREGLVDENKIPIVIGECERLHGLQLI